MCSQLSKVVPWGAKCPDLDTEFARDATKRRVHAILIAGEQTGAIGVPTPGSVRALDTVERDLRDRFGPGPVAIDRLPVGPTRPEVMAAFAAKRTVVADDDLLVVMFAGHGRPAAGEAGCEAWSLTQNEVFSDLDLAAALLACPAHLDIVVISGSCYGKGLFDVGSSECARSGHWVRNSPMVCISAAGDGSLVKLTRLSTLAQDIAAAAAAGLSYRQLAESFAVTAVAGGAFHVDARPVRRLDDLVLGTSRPQRGARTVGSPPNRHASGVAHHRAEAATVVARSKPSRGRL